jgi:hypothetical protein
MSSDHREISALKDRVSSLERENRKARFLHLVALLALVAVFAMGQAHQPPRSIEAKDISIRDDSGKIRVKISAEGINLLDAEGKERSLLVPGSVMLFTRQKGEWEAVVMTGTLIDFMDRSQRVSQLTADHLALHIVDSSKAGSSLAVIMANPQGGTVSVADTKGFSASLGRFPLANVETGSSELTSAASLLLFNNEKRVIWQAP